MSVRWPRVIVHADMDAFYASIEQLDRPELRGRPIVIGPQSPRGVVLTASYEARPYGVGSAMPMVEARRRCPEAIVVSPRFARYQDVSKKIMRVFADFSPRVEPISLDEAFMDMTGAEAIFGAPATLGRTLKEAVKNATGLTVSVGISATKYVAKVASDFRKPDGLTIVLPEDARAWLAPLPAAKLWGAGPKMQQRLAELGFATIGDIAAADAGDLLASLGKAGRVFHALAHGEDARDVDASRASKSIGSERTLTHDICDAASIERHLRAAAEAVGRRLRKHKYAARGVRVKLKRHDFRLLTRQRTLPEPSDQSDVIYRAAAALLCEFDDPGPFRLVGVAAYDLHTPQQSMQLGLLDGETDSRSQKLEAVLDELDARFGAGAVQRAANLVTESGVGPESNLDFLIDDHDD
jgi:DNA polymerase-4